MAYGMIGYGAPGNTVSTAQLGITQNLPSGTIFGDCQSQELIDECTGYFINRDYKDIATLPGLPSQNGTFTYGSGDDSSLNIAFSSTAVVAMFTKPLAPVAPNGSSKLWFEVNVSPQQATNQTLFFGLASSTGLSSTLLATSTTLLQTAGVIGFYTHGDAPTNIDAVYKQAGSTAIQTVLANVLTANANNPNPANLAYVPAGAPGVFTGTNFVKLGLRVDKQYVYFFVNGTQVAKKALDATFDLADSYGAVVACFTAGSASDNLKVGFLRVAAKIAGNI